MAAGGKDTSGDDDLSWRQRYYNELEALENQLQGSLGAQDALRRLSGRLCIAAQGQSQTLDQILDDTLLALRDQEPPESLDVLVRALTKAIETLDTPGQTQSVETPEETPSDPLHSARRSVIELIDHLDFDGEDKTRAGRLRVQLHEVSDAAQLQQLIESLSTLIRHRHQRMSELAGNLRALIRRISTRLTDVTDHLAREDKARHDSEVNSDSLNASIQDQLRDLTRRSREAADLNSLQRAVEQQISRVDQHLLTFRERERELAAAYRERADNLKERIGELETAMRQERERALTDVLTGIPNRAAYQQAAPVFIKGSRRAGRPLCLVVWDIDHFKSINDVHGHQTGDRAITLVARYIYKSLGEKTFTARIGGEEFLSLLPDITARDLQDKLEPVRAGVSALKLEAGAALVSLSVSCGGVELRADDDLDAAYQRADTALYEAKRAGRNCVRVVD